MSKHLDQAREFAGKAEELLKSVYDPAEKAKTCALLAIAHAVLETSFDVHEVKNVIQFRD